MSLFTKYTTPTNVTWQSHSANASLLQNSCVTVNLPDLQLCHTDTAMKVFCFIIWFFWPIFLVGLGLLESVHLFCNSKSDSGIFSVWRRLSDWDWKIEISFSHQPLTKFKLMRKYSLEKLKILNYIFTSIGNALMEQFPTIFSSLFASLAITWLAIYFGSTCISSMFSVESPKQSLLSVGSTLSVISACYPHLSIIYSSCSNAYSLKSFPLF